jgi:hypothetical protein
VTLVAAVGHTLAAAHDRGLVHGRLAADSIVLDACGRPLLTAYALVRCADAAGDVAALVGIALACLGDAVTSPLVAVLESARDARTLATTVLATQRAEPLTRQPTGGGVDRQVGDDSVVRSSRRRGVAVLVSVAVAIAAGAGVLWGRHDPAAGAAPLAPIAIRPSAPGPSAVTPTAGPSVAPWLAVARTLERQRVAALSAADIKRLAYVDMQGTRLWRRDAHVVSSLVAQHAHLRGLRADVRSVKVVSLTPHHAVLLVVDSLSSYVVVGDTGQLLARRPARRAETVRVVLTRRDGRWLLRDATSERSR